MPMGMPGWPERAFSTASTARNRMVFAASVANAVSVRVGALTHGTLHLPPSGARPTLGPPEPPRGAPFIETSHRIAPRTHAARVAPLWPAPVAGRGGRGG